MPRPPQSAEQGRGGRGQGARGRAASPGRGGRGRGRQFESAGPPERVEPVGTFIHACEGEAVCKLTHSKVPFFNGPIYLSNKSQIGKVDEIFGPINSAYFTVKMAEGIVPSSYSEGDTFYIAPEKLLPMDKFLPKPKGSEASKSPGAGGRGGAQQSGRGAQQSGRGGGRTGAPQSGRGGRGPPRGSPRGGRAGGRGGRSGR